MKNTLFTILIIFSSSVSATESLDMALDLFKTKAYRSASVNWSEVEETARKISKKNGENEAISYLVKMLGDPHTSYRSNSFEKKESQQYTRTKKRVEIATISKSISNVPVLQINSWMEKEQVEAALKVREELTRAIRLNSCGLILDFSTNQGGNMWPMVIGLGPLLDSGKLGEFVGSENIRTKIERIDGAIYLGGKPHFLNYKLPVSEIKKPKAIAIIVGPKTASSGEITPMLFLGQDNVLVFGKKTAGFTSANRVFHLPNKARLILTTSQTEDRRGNIYSDGIIPSRESNTPRQDAALWVASQCGGNA